MKGKADWIRHVSLSPGHFVGTPTAQRTPKQGVTTSANSVRPPEECNATSVKSAKRRLPKRKERSFTVAIVHGCHHSPQIILDCLALLADRASLAAIHRIKGVKEETVCAWLQRAAQHVEEIEAVLLANYPITHLTSRRMNGRLVRKSLARCKQLKLLQAACSWEDWVYNLIRPVKTLRVACAACSGQRRWQAQTPAMAAGLTDHIWTIKELLTTVVIPTSITIE